MTTLTTRPVSPLTVAKNRWDEATRVADAYKIVWKRRLDAAWKLSGQEGETRAWESVAEAEVQLNLAEQAEVKAATDVAWEERKAGLARRAALAREARGR